MAKLVLSMDGQVLKEVVLTKERTTIGRKPHNDLVIDNLAVSGEHAVVVTILSDSFLEDLGSTNGTFVNGQPVKKHFLQNGDVVELGKYKLKFIAEPSSAIPNEFDRTLVVPSGTATVALTGDRRDTPAVTAALETTQDLGQTASMLSLSPPPAASGGTPGGASAEAAARELAVIRVLSGPGAGRELVLVKALTTLGKAGQVAVITRRPQGYFLTHVEGTELPVVNGRALGAEAQLLADKDIIVLSGARMEFIVRPS